MVVEVRAAKFEFLFFLFFASIFESLRLQICVYIGYSKRLTINMVVDIFTWSVVFKRQ